MKHLLTDMGMKTGLPPIAAIVLYSIIKITSPYLNEPDTSVIKEEVKHVEEVFQKEPQILTEEVPEKTFEEIYSDEPYIFLVHSVDIEVNPDWSYVVTLHKKIKIQKSGYKSLGTIPITYVKGREKIISIEAYTTVPDGEKYSYSSIQDRPVYQGYKNYSDVREKIITLPKVTEGSIIEYKVVREVERKAIDNHFWHTGYLDFSVPAKYDRYSVVIPKELNIFYKEFNVREKPEIEETENSFVYKWEFKETYEPEEEEKYIPFPTHENLEDIFQFSSIESWAEVSDWYYELTSKRVTITDEIKNQAEEVFEGKKTVREKALSLLEYFNENFRYISISFGENTFEPHSTEEVFNNKYGDCKDISLLFKTMLEVGGVKSHLALFTKESTSSDPQYDLPVPGLFNHVLLFVEDPEEGDFYLDPLLEGYYLEEYPMSFQGAYTFIINDQGGKFDRMPIFDEDRYYKGHYSRYVIESDGSCECEFMNLWTLDFSIDTRRSINNMSTEELFKMFSYIDRSHTEVLDRSWDGVGNKYGPIESYLKTREEKYFPVTGDIIILNMDACDVAKNYDNLEREHDFFYPYNSLDVDKNVFKIPEDYEVFYMPDNINLNIEFIDFTREYSINKDKEIVVYEETRLKRATVPAEESEKVFDFYRRLAEGTEQRIILKKRKTIIEEFKDFARRILARF